MEFFEDGLFQDGLIIQFWAYDSFQESSSLVLNKYVSRYLFVELGSFVLSNV